MRTLWRGAAPLAFVVAGVMFAASAGAAHGGDLRGGSRTDLGELIRAEERRADEVAQRVERLRAQIDEETARAAETDRRVAEASDLPAGVELASGATPVVGPGVRVVLADAPRGADRALPPDATADDLVVHQQDLQAVVNALWQGGAEAMRIMDQRVISTSAVRCVGNTLILQGRVYSPPFEITAIGDPDRLMAALDASPGVATYRYYVDRFGLRYDTDELERVRLPAYEEALDLQYVADQT